MSNQEQDPDEVVCGPGGEDGRNAVVEPIEPREVPLGGPRAMHVRRTLPQRRRSLVGAWCFVDHYGPDDVAQTGGMNVPPHPHTGLQTVSWLFAGEVLHRDSVGTEALVRPGELNLMTAGRGVSHSEVSTEGTEVLHGVQLWVALPEARRECNASFEHHAPEPVAGPGLEARVFLGELLGERSPVATATPLLGAEIRLEPDARVDLDVDEAHELGVLVDEGSVEVARGDAEPAEVKRHVLGYAAPGEGALSLRAGGDGARLLLLGGPPFGEEIVMWWNFVGGTHEDVEQARADWQLQLERGRGGALVRDSQDVSNGRFGVVIDDHAAPIPAPPMPHTRLRARR